MKNKTKILQSFSNTKLIDVIKNYRQYGYDNSLRKIAVGILKERGITIKDLKLTGNLRNQNFDSAERLFRRFKKNSRLAIIFYCALLILNILIPVFHYISEFSRNINFILNFIVIVGFLFYWLKAFQNQSDFYRMLGKKMDSYEVLIFLLIGMPLYIFMYLYYKHKLKEELQLIK